MDAQLQLCAFELAGKTFELRHHIEEMLRLADGEPCLINLSLFQRLPAALGECVERLVLQMGDSNFAEHSAEIISLLEQCRLDLVALFQNGEVSGFSLSQAKRFNEDAARMSTDLQGPEWSYYSDILTRWATERLTPLLELLETSLPEELRPFFRFCGRTWTIPSELHRWCHENSCDNSAIHTRIVNTTRPELRALLAECVVYQPGLSGVSVTHMDCDMWKLEDELAELRRSVHFVLFALASPTTVDNNVSLDGRRQNLDPQNPTEDTTRDRIQQVTAELAHRDRELTDGQAPHASIQTTDTSMGHRASRGGDGVHEQITRMGV